MRSAIQRRIQQVIVLLAVLLVVLLLWAAALPNDLQQIAEPPSPSPILATQLARVTPAVSPSPTPFSLPPPETQDIAIDRRGQVSATVRRGDLLMTLLLPTSRVEAGSLLSAELLFSNENPDLSFSIYSRLRLRGEQRSLGDDWPNLTLNRWGYIPVAPSSTVSVPLTLYIPPEAQARGLAPRIWAETVVQVSPGNDGAPSWWMELGPIFLQVGPAPAERSMPLVLEVDEQGWRLAVISATREIQGPFWGAIRHWHPDGTQTSRQLSESQNGEWAERWAAPAVERLDALVIAPGAVAMVISRTVTITSTQQQEFYSFAGIAEAEAFLGRPIPTLERLPPGAELDLISIYRPQQPVRGIEPSFTIRYRLRAGIELRVWRPLTGQAALRPSIGERKQLFPDMHEVTIGEASGLASRRLGEWRLEWDLAGARLDLSAPVSSASLAELMTLAEQLR